MVPRLALALTHHARAVAAAGRVRLAGGRVGRGAVVMHDVQLWAALRRAAVYALPPSVAGAARCHSGRSEERGEGRGAGVGTGADGRGAGMSTYHYDCAPTVMLKGAAAGVCSAECPIQRSSHAL